MSRFFFFCALLLPFSALAQYAPDRYALILTEPPAGARYAQRERLFAADGRAYLSALETRQRTLRSQLQTRGVRVSGSVSTLLNAVFVAAPPERVDELKALPGVAAVVPMRRGRKLLNKAADLMKLPEAWALPAIGGRTNGGRGVKIGIIDTGIDQTHPMFADPSLTVPEGYPICTKDHPEDCAFTNNKVIVARSYVRQVAGYEHASPPDLGRITGPPVPSESQPDDYSPRDRSGHGTAVASAAAGALTRGETVEISGMAPKAYLGSYKVYGTPGVNDYPSEDVFIQAIEDALNDGMDVVNLSSGFPATTGPLDTGAACGLPAGAPCDPIGMAFETAARHGLVIVAAAGNSGRDDYAYTGFPVYGSLSTPAVAPSVIAVGATLNSHVFWPAVSVLDPAAPASVRKINAFPSDAWPLYAGSGALSAPLIDAAALGDSHACAAFADRALDGAFVLVEDRWLLEKPCTLGDKARNVQDAGALGMILYLAPDSPPLGNNGTALEGVYDFTGPVAAIANADGVALKNYLKTHQGSLVRIDLAGSEQPYQDANQLASYSSLGPAPAAAALCATCAVAPVKPDVVATGGGDSYLMPDPWWSPLYGFQGMYTATQTFDSTGDLYSDNGYTAWDGSSVAAPLVAGAAALVKQAHPGWTAAQIRSAIVNSRGSRALIESDMGDETDVRWVGAGMLDAGAAAKATVVAAPSAVSFGAIPPGGSLPKPQSVTITNLGGNPVSLTVSVAPDAHHAGAAVSVDKQTLSLGAAGSANATADLTVSLGGSVPPAGSYSGNISLSGAGAAMNVPYLFLMGNNTAGADGNLIPVFGSYFEGLVSQNIGAIAMKLVDGNGLPVTGAPVVFSTDNGGVTPRSAAGAPPCTGPTAGQVTCATDAYGIAYADLVLGANEGFTTLRARGPNNIIASAMVYVREKPAAASVSDSAQGKTHIVPGSYVSIYGSFLSDVTKAASTARLPLSLEGVTASFDAGDRSVPGRVLFVSPGQVNVQVPWELAGVPDGAAVKVKVSAGQSMHGNVLEAPLAEAAPSFFETAPNNAAALIANSATVVGDGRAAPRGGWIQVYVNGLGPVDAPPESGDPAPLTVLAWARNKPAVKVGGKEAEVNFWGLAPGFPGLYQVNVRIPADLAPGRHAIEMTVAGRTAASGIPVE